MKIIFFGDSLTQGTFGASYVDKVAAAMRGHHFINQGVNGDTSLNLYRRVEQDVIAEHPDGVFVMIGVNDAVAAVEPASHLYFRFAKRLPHGQTSPVAFRENMRALLSKLVTSQLKVWVALPPIEYNPAQVKMLRQMNTNAADVCRELNIPRLDLMLQMTPPEIPNRPPIQLSNYATNLLRTFGGIHLTDDGAQRIADLVVPFLRANGVK
jgi:lysophospholipase L1-like esterase